jgi:hypothetical protein
MFYDDHIESEIVKENERLKRSFVRQFSEEFRKQRKQDRIQQGLEKASLNRESSLESVKRKALKFNMRSERTNRKMV